MLIFAALLAVHAGLAGTIPAAPANITVTFISPQSVRISWQIASDLQKKSIEKYLVTFKPTNDRVVQQVAGNSEAVILDHLLPNTQYQLSVAAVLKNQRFKSRQVIFKTLELTKGSSQNVGSAEPMAPHTGNGHSLGIYSDGVLSSTTGAPPNSTTRELPTIRGVEVGIVVLVLIVWAGAIALFFNRWGKIRMLLPYQPDYKQEQLKVPGTGVCTGSACNGQHSHQCEGSEVGALVNSQTKLRHFHYLQDEPSTTISERCTRSRINSAIFVSSEGRGFDSIEFLRRHGSQSVLCRKARSAENISDEDRKRRFSENQQWCTEDSSHPSETIELAECHATPSTLASTSVAVTITPSIVATAENATQARANSIVGSISIEKPPSHIQQQLQNASPAANPIQATTAPASSSAIALNLTNSKPLTNLPTLSISGPSPPHDGEFL